MVERRPFPPGPTRTFGPPLSDVVSRNCGAPGDFRWRAARGTAVEVTAAVLARQPGQHGGREQRGASRSLLPGLRRGQHLLDRLARLELAALQAGVIVGVARGAEDATAAWRPLRAGRPWPGGCLVLV